MFYFGIHDNNTGVFSDPTTQLQTMIDASRSDGVGLGTKFCQAWNLDGVNGKIVTDLNDASQMQGIDCIFSWKPNEPSAPGALGFHDEKGGIPYAELLTDPLTQSGAGIFDGGSGGLSFLSVFQHELFEAMLDLYIGNWVQMPDGRFIAQEACDPVETVLVPITLTTGVVVYGSDAVLPHYFDSQAQASDEFDLAGQVTSPFQLLSGGYQIIYDPTKLADPNGPVSQVFGNGMPWWIRDAKMCSKARGYRRVRKGLAAAINYARKSSGLIP